MQSDHLKESMGPLSLQNRVEFVSVSGGMSFYRTVESDGLCLTMGLLLACLADGGTGGRVLEHSALLVRVRV